MSLVYSFLRMFRFRAEQFRPEEVPTLEQLVDELDAFARNADNKDKNIKQEWKKTSMKEPMRIFEDFLTSLYKGRKIEISDSKMEF